MLSVKYVTWILHKKLRKILCWIWKVAGSFYVNISTSFTGVQSDKTFYTRLRTTTQITSADGWYILLKIWVYYCDPPPPIHYQRICLWNIFNFANTWKSKFINMLVSFLSAILLFPTRQTHVLIMSPRRLYMSSYFIPLLGLYEVCRTLFLTSHRRPYLTSKGRT